MGLPTRYTESKMEACDDMKPLVVSYMSDPYRFYCQFDSKSVDSITSVIESTYSDETSRKHYTMSEEFLRPGWYIRVSLC